MIRKRDLSPSPPIEKLMSINDKSGQCLTLPRKIASLFFLMTKFTEPSYIVDSKLVQSLWKTVWRFLRKLKMELS